MLEHGRDSVVSEVDVGKVVFARLGLASDFGGSAQEFPFGLSDIEKQDVDVNTQLTERVGLGCNERTQTRVPFYGVNVCDGEDFHALFP